ncbi:phosphatase [Candidatus Margulisiibacteriota bacterium]
MTKIKMVADLHIHTVASGHAYSTIEEYVVAAKKKGLKCIAITDHGPAMPGGAPVYYFSNLRMIPDSVNGIRILKGAEVNIIDENGRLDIPDEALETLDFAIAAMHPRCGYESQGEEKNTEVLLKALENPYIRVIAHPGNPMYPINYKKIAPIIKKKGVLFELNNSSLTISRKGSYDRCFDIAKEIKNIGWKVAIGSDSHISTMVGDLNVVTEMAVNAGLEKDDIINTSMDLIEKYLIKK